MNAITYTLVRASLDRIMDRVCEDHAPLKGELRGGEAARRLKKRGA